MIAMWQINQVCAVSSTGIQGPFIQFDTVVCFDKIGDIVDYDLGPTCTRYSNRTQIFLYYSNPTRKFLKLPTIAFAIRYSIWYSDFFATTLLQVKIAYSNKPQGGVLI